VGLNADRASILPIFSRFCRKIASHFRNRSIQAGDSRPLSKGSPAMKWSPGGAGFNARSAPAASSRLTDAVAATLAIGALSLFVIVTLTVFSIKVSMAMPIPA
jgi:hypothetical protein